MITDLKVFDKQYQLLINGKWTNGSEGKLLTSYNPSNNEKLADIIDATNKDVDDAVKAAQKALNDWKNISVEERSNILLKIADIIEENKDLLALQETLDNGKPIRETKNVDIPEAIDHFRYFAGAIRAEEGSAKFLNKNTLTIAIREPIGVVGQIIPWNFPFLMAAWKIAPALAAGNTIVIHPSSTTSLSLLSLGKLINHLLPPGVLNIITGKGSVSGEYMQNHPGFNKLAFTGSTEIGRNIGISAAKRLIPATLELGGKSANIFFDDMPFDKAIEGAQIGILFNQGQVCCAGSRIFVQENIYEKFIDTLITEFKKVKVGLPWLEDTQMGAQINKAQVNKICEYIDIGKKDGKILVGGEKFTEGELKNGAFLKPTLIELNNNKHKISQEEIFGPVAVVMKFKTEEEVINLANDSIYGLGGGVWTKDINKAFRVATKIQTGRMWVNTYNQVPAGAPFGGYKESGIGRETHKMILDAYSQTKNIYIDINENRIGLY